jgi:TonB-linked SusC/RagA family outer membrane protein
MRDLSSAVQRLTRWTPRRCWNRELWLRSGVALSLLVLASQPAAAQQGVVSGTVVGEQSLRPLAGAQVQVVGTDRGSITDAGGRFMVAGVTGTEVTLRVSMLGYRPVTRAVPVGTTNVRIGLTETAVELDEVIVTGTAGATQRRALGNAVTTVNATQALEVSAASDVSSLINGRAPGVIITPGTGRVGSGPSINIRGRSTISLSQQPLIYIDGVRVNNDIGTGPQQSGFGAISRLNDINPEDIASMEIIKGPAAATLYGTEAANGVIQIITKRGVAGARPEFTVSTRQGTSWFQNAEERMRTNFARHPTTGEILTFNPVRYEAERGRSLFDTGRHQGYNVGVRGGTEMIRYYISTAYDDEDGVEPGNSLRRFTGHTNLAIAATERLDIESSLNVVKGRTALGGGSQNGMLINALFGNPLFEALNRPAGPYLSFSPEIFREVYETWQDLNRFTGSVRLNHRPLDWFQHRLTLGLDQTGEDNQFLRNFAPPHLENQFGSPAAARGGLLQQLRSIAYVTADYDGTVTRPLTAELTSATSVGAQYYRRRDDRTNITADEFPEPGLRTAAAAARVVGSQDYETNATLGVFGQQQFAWQNRLFLTGALRVDNNSAFGEDIQFVTYPKLSGTWVVSEEPFWTLAPLEQFRLRAAYGASGQQPRAFAALRTFQPATGRNDLPIVVPQSLGNPNLRPERGEELEVGFDADLLGRVGLEFTYFNRRVRDAILARTIAPSSGFSGTQFVNIGEISNRGVEMLANVQALTLPDLAWDVSVSYSTARDRIEDLGGIPFIALGLPTQRHVEGHPIGGFWTREIVSAELDAAGRAVNIRCNDGAGGSVACPQAPQLFFGTPTPTRNAALTTSVTLWNSLRLHGMADYKGGHTLLNTNDFVRCTLLRICEANVRPLEADPILIAATQIGGDFSAVSPFLEDGSYVKLREISASYTVPDRWARQIGATRANLTVAGRNLHTWTRFNGLDPEGRANVDNAVLSNDQAVLPVLPQLVTSVRLNF